MEDFSKLTKQELIDRLNAKTAVIGNDSEDEMTKLNRLAVKSDPHAIPFMTKNDHKNVFLYTAINKRIGPLHPENAKRTMEKFKRAGIQLYVNRRTDQQIEDFKKTDEYKKAFEDHQKLRAKRHEDVKRSEIKKFLKENITILTADTAEAIKSGK